MKLAIVGSEGFIGTALARQCAEADVDVVTVDAVPSSSRHHRVADIRSASLRDAIPDDADAIVHLAAVSRDRDCADDLEGALAINIAATRNVLEAARELGIPQLIFASSEWVYGDVAGQDVQREEAPIDVNSLTSTYALTKIFAERILDAAWRENPRTAVTVLRFAIVYGPRPKDWSAVEHLHDQVRTSDTVRLNGSRKTARRFIHVDDLCRGVIKAVGQRGFDVFNLSGDRLISLADIIDESSKLLGREPAVVEADPSAITIRNPDNAKAKRVLGWQPSIDLRSGLATLAKAMS